MKYWRISKKTSKRVSMELGTEAVRFAYFFYTAKNTFNVDKFKEFNALLGWNRNRFEKLRREGWIDVIKPYKFGGPKALYGLSFKSSHLIRSIYDKLEGGPIPMAKSKNPIFLAQAGYSDKVYRKMIEKMNQAIRQEQCHSLEL
jgi:hypothetical protein